eukprot:1656840-Alexandrium_andersonii.AAC.1
MSASLVGSEDVYKRQLLMVVACAALLVLGGAGKRGCRREKAKENKEGSVSYTHLTLPTICSV